MFKKKLCLTREFSFNGRKKFFSLVKLDKMRTKKRSFVSNQGITQSWGNRLVQGQCRRTFHRFNSERATILAAFLKGSNKELHKRHPSINPAGPSNQIKPSSSYPSFTSYPDWIILVPTRFWVIVHHWTKRIVLKRRRKNWLLIFKKFFYTIPEKLYQFTITLIHDRIKFKRKNKKKQIFA